MNRVVDPNNPWPSFMAYLTSALLFFGKIINILNEYAAAFGVLFGFCTVVMNYRFQKKKLELIKINKDDDEL